jgi:hypothetical protein
VLIFIELFFLFVDPLPVILHKKSSLWHPDFSDAKLIDPEINKIKNTEEIVKNIFLINTIYS